MLLVNFLSLDKSTGAIYLAIPLGAVSCWTIRFIISLVPTQIMASLITSEAALM
jgi:hypothetical protein